MRQSNPDTKLADAQVDLAKRYGFSSWRALKAHIDSLTWKVDSSMPRRMAT